MWEYCIEVQKQNRYLLDYISNKLENTIKNIRGIQTIVDYDNRVNLSIGCGNEYKTEIINVLQKIICDTICEKMKFDYLKNHIDLNIKDNKMFKAFIKVYTYFDNDIEKAIVMRTLHLKDKIILESFLYFRLSMLIKKWEEMCNLTNLNNGIFIKSETFSELLKFLIANLDFKNDCILLDFDNKDIYIENDNQLILVNHFFVNDEVDLLSKIIELNPRKIKINTIDDYEIITKIVDLFEGRTEIVK